MIYAKRSETQRRSSNEASRFADVASHHRDNGRAVTVAKRAAVSQRGAEP
eukprot:CAMPEP_0194037452 /NCGR_PEP_ID=MMETSP0009_2-20130614/9806_1 /TAXON_ID=210454 /ORGANISM="Grammatophora oceanica, Strain CCMP 410" /LENGTH=49 /DNA_ID= /DNA_START= /DNA_END= /DNA_ORIENTATION=